LRTIPENNSTTTGGVSSQYYVYDQSDAILDFYDSDGPSNLGGTGASSVLWNRYLWNITQATDQLLAQEYLPSTAGGGAGGEGGAPELWWTLPDRLGSIREYQRADNGVTYIYYYDSYGKKTQSLIVHSGATFYAGDFSGYIIIIESGATLYLGSGTVLSIGGAGTLNIGCPAVNREFRYLFTCQEYDSIAALYYYDARW